MVTATGEIMGRYIPARGKKNKRGDKAKAQVRHASRRAEQRFGVTIDQHEWVRQIRTGLAEFIDRQSCRVSRWWILHEGQRIPVVYDKQRGVIVTVLTPEMILGKPAKESENEGMSCDWNSRSAKSWRVIANFRDALPDEQPERFGFLVEASARQHYDRMLKRTDLSNVFLFDLDGQMVQSHDFATA